MIRCEWTIEKKGLAQLSRLRLNERYYQQQRISEENISFVGVCVQPECTNAGVLYLNLPDGKSRKYTVEWMLEITVNFS